MHIINVSGCVFVSVRVAWVAASVLRGLSTAGHIVAAQISGTRRPITTTPTTVAPASLLTNLHVNRGGNLIVDLLPQDPAGQPIDLRASP